jgi:hypothetical protein
MNRARISALSSIGALLFYLLCFLFLLASACAAGAQAGFALGDDGGAEAGPVVVVVATDDGEVTIPIGQDAGAVLGALFDDAGGDTEDASSDDARAGPPFDAGDAGACSTPLGPGDLAIVELMIESTSGTGDHGEWLEVRSTRACAVDLAGLHGETSASSKVYSFDVEGDLWLPAGGSVVVADSSNAAMNHALPGIVLTWSGEPGDVLRNEGATVSLLSAGVLIDSVTYPKLKLTPGASLAFPADCAASLRADWSDWQFSTASWFPAFQGTPNARNDDVTCAVTEDGGT